MRLYAGGYLDVYLPQRRNRVEIEVIQPTSLKEILTRLGIPAGEVLLIVINGELVDLEGAVVSGQDEVKLYPAVDGG
jgi:sulfur carrier protein ThiS